MAALFSLTLNGMLLVVAFSVDPRREELSRIENIADALLRPAGMFTEQIVPGHSGAQVTLLFLSSIFFYAVIAWLLLSLPVWWRHRT